jgi:hypothetical protein
MTDFPNIPSPNRKGRILLYYDASDNVEYICKHTYNDASTSDSSWEITKLIYDVSDNIEDIQKLTGSVDNRASLGWQ